MVFIVTRTSGDKPKCAGLIEATIPNVESLRVPTEFKPDTQSKIDRFYAEGENHRVSRDGFTLLRDNGTKKAYTIEIQTIEQLVDFIHENGDSVVIEPYWQDGEYMKIEIYDDYRE